MGSGGQKNWPPFFSCFIYPKVPLHQKSQNEHENLADDGIFNILKSTNTL